MGTLLGSYTTPDTMTSSSISHSPFGSHETGSSLIVGSTGSVGRQVLSSLLTASNFSKVIELGRRPTSYPVHGVPTPSAADQAKLTAVTVDNDTFEDPIALASKLPSEKDWSSVFITLGTTRANAGGAAQFEKIDREYVLNAVKAARFEGSTQRLLYCSSAGANSSAPFLYPKSKGLTEQGLAKSGYTETIIFRPGFLRVVDGREQHRMMESVFGLLTHHVLSRVSNNAEIDTDVLGKAMVRAGEMGIEACLKSGVGSKEKLEKDGPEVLVINNGDAIKLAKLQL